MFQFVQEARDQTQPGSLFSRSGGRGERDPGNEVGDSAQCYIQCMKCIGNPVVRMDGRTYVRTVT